MAEVVKKHLALIGCPLGHSVSPLIHQALAAEKQLSLSYTLQEIPPAALAERFATGLSALDGFNVTIPHKTEIVPLLDSLSPRAALFGAVNTVRREEGRFVGYNTDCEGFLRSVKAAGIAIDGNVLITGCGGAARMFAFECLLAGAQVTLAVRDSSLTKAAALQQEIRDKLQKEIRLTALQSVDGAYDLIINATPVGMAPHTDACPLAAAAVKKAGAVFDAIYNPTETQLLKIAREAGIPGLNGLPMLVWQAAVAEELWNGVTFTEEEVARVTALAEKELKNR
ncbi:MAG: shikimate dehydrogenase [Eubacterium sp.]|nr:shikimate dehydrogenase [Eubacterium sp.]